MTAVEWLIEQIEDTISNTIVAKAKEMEKKQIIDAFKEGTKMVDINDELSAGFNAVMYFYKTYDSNSE